MRKVAFVLLLLIACLAHAEDMTEALRFTAPKKWALVIGASDYAAMGKLKYSVNDARAFSDVLQSHLGFTKDTITLLTDDPQGEKKPTSENILAALDGLLSDPTLDRGDLFIFYFSGHGVGLASGDYLAPTDASMENVANLGLPVKEVVKRIVNKGLKNVLFIADACRSGEKNPFGAEIQELGTKSNIAVFLGCAPGKRSYELAKVEKGAFTHNLLETIESGKTDFMGGLWASDAAETTSENTFKSTEPNYGKYAQKPSTWAFENQDILLSASPSPPFLKKLAESRNLTNTLQSLGAKKAQYRDLLIDFSYYALKAGAWGVAQKCLQASAQLQPLSDREQLLLGVINHLTGDLVASNKSFQLVLKSKSPYFHALAVTLDPTGSSTLAERAKASETIYKAERAFAYAEGAYAFTQSPTEKLKIATRFIQAKGKDSKEGLYWQGRLLEDAGKLPEAKMLLMKAAAAPGDPEVTHYACIQIETIAKTLGDVDGQLAAWDMGMKIKGKQVYWALSMAEFMRDLDRQKSIDALNKFLDHQYNPSPRDLFEAVKIAGLYAGKLLPALKRFETVYPYSPEYHMAVWLAEYFNDPKQFFDLPPAVTQFAADPVEIRYDAFFAMWRGFVEQKDIQLIQKMAMGGEFVSSFVPLQDRFAKNDLVWRELIEWGVPANRQLQLYRLAEKHLFPFVLTGKAEGILASQALKIAMNLGEDQMAEKIYRAYDWDKVAKDEERLRYAAYLAVRGNLAGSKAEWKRTKRRDNLRGYFELYDGLQFLYKLSEKKTDALLKEFEAWDPGGDIGMNIKGYVGAIFTNDVKHVNYLSVCVDYYNPEFWYLSAACLQQMEKNLRTLKESNPAGTDQTRMGWVWLQAGYGTAFHKEAGYAVNSSVGDFQGTYKYSYSYIYEPERAKGNQDGTVDIFIAADGKAAVTATLAMGKKIELSGVIDRFGNLNLRSADGWELTAKIPPLKMQDKIDMLQKYDQQFALLDPKCERMIGGAKPVRGEGSRQSTVAVGSSNSGVNRKR